MSCDSDNLNIDDKSLFKYVMELEQVGTNINSVGPADSTNVGNMVEPFKGGRKNIVEKKKGHSYMFWVCVVLLVAFALYMVFSSPCSKKNVMDMDMDMEMNIYDLPVYEYRPMRATFTRDY
jgi:hypothetical protein